MIRKAKLRIQILLRSRAATAAFSWLTFSKQLKLIQYIASKFIETEESFQEMAGLLSKRPYHAAFLLNSLNEYLLKPSIEDYAFLPPVKQVEECEEMLSQQEVKSMLVADQAKVNALIGERERAKIGKMEDVMRRFTKKVKLAGDLP